MSLSAELEEFQGRVLAAGEVLRGSINSHEYSEYVLPLIFLKYISDLDRIHDIRQWKSGSNDRKLWLANKLDCIFSRKRSRIPDFYTLQKQRNEYGLGERINEIFRIIENSCPDELENVFSLIDFDSYRLGNTSERHIVLNDLIDAISEVSFSQSLIDNYLYRGGDLFSIAVETLTYHRKNDTSVVPFEISRLVGKLLESRDHERIYDPSAGSGSLLIASATEDLASFTGLPRIFGTERNVVSWSLSRMSAFLHAECGNGIEVGGGSTDHFNDRDSPYEVAVSFPPWGSKENIFPSASSDIRKRFLPSINSKLSTEYAAILHMLSVLDMKEGRLAVIVPSGSLSKGGTEKFVRQRLVEENYIDAVIELPEKVIAGTVSRFSIIMIKTRRSIDEVLLIDATTKRSLSRGHVRMSTEQVEEIVNVYRDFQYKKSSSNKVSIDEIAENDFNLSISSFKKKEEFRNQVDILSIRTRKEKLKHTLEQIEAEIDECLKQADLR